PECGGLREGSRPAVLPAGAGRRRVRTRAAAHPNRGDSQGLQAPGRDAVGGVASGPRTRAGTTSSWRRSYALGELALARSSSSSSEIAGYEPHADAAGYGGPAPMRPARNQPTWTIPNDP